MYRCLNCQKEIKLEQTKEGIRCPYCGYRVLVKERPKSVVKVSAR